MTAFMYCAHWRNDGDGEEKEGWRVLVATWSMGLSLFVFQIRQRQYIGQIF